MMMTLDYLALRKKCPYSELFSSVFSRIRIEYGPEYLRHFSRSVGHGWILEYNIWKQHSVGADVTSRQILMYFWFWELMNP